MTDARGVLLRLSFMDVVKVCGLCLALITGIAIPFARWMTVIHEDVHELKRDMVEVKGDMIQVKSSLGIKTKLATTP